MPGKSPAYICSAALNALGADSIIALSDDSRRGRLCNRLWPVVRDEVLASRNWGVTFERAILTKDNDTPTFDYGARFRLPSDSLFILSNDLPRESRFTIEGDFFLCDYDSVSIVYIKDTQDSNEYGPLLVSAMIAAMKAALAYPITGNQAIADAANAEKEQKLGIAAQRESNQRSQVALQADILVRVRR